MNTKEAIGVCKCLLNWPLEKIRTTEENIGELREVIETLKRGEKFEEMWEELFRLMVNIQQKYFPKTNIPK